MFLNFEWVMDSQHIYSRLSDVLIKKMNYMIYRIFQ